MGAQTRSALVSDILGSSLLRTGQVLGASAAGRAERKHLTVPETSSLSVKWEGGRMKGPHFVSHLYKLGHVLSA